MNLPNHSTLNPQPSTHPDYCRVAEFLIATAGVAHLWAGKEVAALLEIHPRTWRRWHRRAGVAPCLIAPNHGHRWTVAGVLLVLRRIGGKE